MTVKVPGHMCVLDRFLWLDGEARPETQKNESNNKTKSKVKQNTKTGQEATEKFQTIKMESLTREAEQQKKRRNQKATDNAIRWMGWLVYKLDGRKEEHQFPRVWMSGQKGMPITETGH